jgi:LuxR family maltose regulon positive regulatory protein
LYLAALSLRDHPAPANFARDFTGGNRYIVDFLAEEVIGRQPKPIQQFLMRTAVLSRFTAPLCDAVTGRVNARDVIDKLERENSFLIALDDKREWFRYHHLFAQLLLGQLDRAEPGAIRALHQRASAWYLERGSADEAIGHALAAGDFTRSATLIAQHWYLYMDAGRAATLRSWLRSLGDDNISTSPLAAHSAAWVAALTGDREAVRRWLPVVAAGGDQGLPLPDGIRSLRSSAALLALRAGQTTPGGRLGAPPTGGRSGCASPAKGDTAGPCVSRVITRYRTIRHQTATPARGGRAPAWLLVIGSLRRGTARLTC